MKLIEKKDGKEKYWVWVSFDDKEEELSFRFPERHLATNWYSQVRWNIMKNYGIEK